MLQSSLLQYFETVWGSQWIQLQRIKPGVFPGFACVHQAIASEDADCLHTLRQLLHNLPRPLQRHTPRTLLIKHKPHRIRPRVHRDQRILQIRHPANLYPSHKPVLSSQLSVASTVSSCWVLSTEHWVLASTAATPPQETPPASTTRPQIGRASCRER